MKGESSPPSNLFRSGVFVPRSEGDSIACGYENTDDDDEEAIVPETDRAPENVKIEAGEDIQPIIEIPETSFFPTGACDLFTY